MHFLAKKIFCEQDMRVFAAASKVCGMEEVCKTFEMLNTSYTGYTAGLSTLIQSYYSNYFATVSVHKIIDY